MSHQLTITVSDEVFESLQQVAGERTISEVIEEWARPAMAEASLEAAYREMSKDEEREREAQEWIEGVVGDALPDALPKDDNGAR